MNNFTAGVREREDANRTREAGHLDEIQGAVANTLKSYRTGASLLAKTFGVGFIGWLGRTRLHLDPCKANRVHEMRSQVKTYSNEWPSHMSGGVDNNRRLPSNLKCRT